MVYTCNGILLSHEEKWSSDTHYCEHEPQKLYAKWKKPDTKGHQLYDLVSLKCPDEADPQRQNTDWQSPGARCREQQVGAPC